MLRYLFFISVNIQTRMADDRFVFGFRFSSMCAIIDAMDELLFLAIRCNSAKNSSSNDMLVW